MAAAGAKDSKRQKRCVRIFPVISGHTPVRSTVQLPSLSLQTERRPALQEVDFLGLVQCTYLLWFILQELVLLARTQLQRSTPVIAHLILPLPNSLLMTVSQNAAALLMQCAAGKCFLPALTCSRLSVLCQISQVLQHSHLAGSANRNGLRRLRILKVTTLSGLHFYCLWTAGTVIDMTNPQSGIAAPAKKLQNLAAKSNGQKETGKNGKSRKECDNCFWLILFVWRSRVPRVYV